jgi:hypothetical protein
MLIFNYYKLQLSSYRGCEKKNHHIGKLLQNIAWSYNLYLHVQCTNDLTSLCVIFKKRKFNVVFTEELNYRHTENKLSIQ